MIGRKCSIVRRSGTCERRVGQGMKEVRRYRLPGSWDGEDSRSAVNAAVSWIAILEGEIVAGESFVDASS